ncbi:MAG: bla regulator protein BlaR1 [Glaciecola sp.]|jgi:bla regulator protein BlaR1
MLDTFFIWLIEQQLLLSLLLLTIVLLERYCLKALSPSFVYKLVFIIPLAVLLSNLPDSFKPSVSNQISYYLISPDSNYLTEASWEWVYAYSGVAIVLLVYIFKVHMRFVSDLDLSPIHLKESIKGKNITGTFVSPAIKTPMVIGLFNNKLALPIDYDKQFSGSSLKLILEHESIHIQRKDNLSNTLFLLLTVLLWFNPIAWLAYGSFRRLQELSCDERVLSNKTFEQHILYSKALVSCTANSPTTLMAYSHYGDKKMILQRLTNIKHIGANSKIAKGGLLLAAACMLSTLAIAKSAPHEESKADHVAPISRVAPVYPKQAVEQGLSGNVVLKFDVTPTGATSNISVVNSTPSGVFDREAKKSLAQWKYRPSEQGYQNVLVQLDFALN